MPYLLMETETRGLSDMADKYIISVTKLTAIADAIRAKTGGTDTLTADQMAAAIAGIKGESDSDTWCRKAINQELSGDVKVPDDITALPPYLWYDNRSGKDTCVNSINLNNVKEVSESLFYTANYGALNSITFTNAQRAIGKRAFYGAGITELTIPGNVKAIYDGAFNQCAYLQTVTFEPGDRITIYYYSTFAYKKFFLTNPDAATLTVTFNRDVTFSSGTGVFSGRSGSIILTTGGCMCTSGTFDGFTGKIYVPAAYLDKYKTGTNWSKYADIIVASS